MMADQQSEDIADTHCCIQLGFLQQGLALLYACRWVLLVQPAEEWKEDKK